MIKYQSWFVEYFAERYKNEETILAWNFGNETDVIPCRSRESGCLWMDYLRKSMKACSITQPITTGSHHLGSSISAKWRIQDVSRFSDFMIIHPYPCVDWYPEFTDSPLSPLTTFFPAFLGRFYGGVGKRPVLCEEFGNLGEGVMDEDETAPKYAGRLLDTLLANGVEGGIWWCYSDYSCDEPPYNTVQMENDGLGLFTDKCEPKAAVAEFTRVATTAARLDYAKLDAPVRDAAIIAPWKEEARMAMYGAFVLSKMSGIEPDVIYCEDEFAPEARLLIFPALHNFDAFLVEDWERIKKFIENGGTFYASLNGGVFKRMKDVFGFKMLGRRFRRAGEETFSFGGNEFSVAIPDTWLPEIKPLGNTRILATNSKGKPAVIETSYGKGKAILNLYPLEAGIIGYPDWLSPAHGTIKLYEYLKNVAGSSPYLVE